MRKPLKFHRLQAGYFYSATAVRYAGRSTHVVIERSDGGTYWMLRIESFPGMTSIHQTKRHAQFALAELLSGNSALVLQ
jgi:hypothetical protein